MMHHFEIPIVDEEKIFGPRSEKLLQGPLPIGSIYGCVSGPGTSSHTDFRLCFYEIEEHNAVSSTFTGPTEMAAKLKALYHIDYPVVKYVLFMGQYRPVAPKEIEAFLPFEHYDLLRVIEANLI